jgi:single-stranded-DNA-specific exonuclease
MAAGLTLRESSLASFEVEFAREVERWIDEDTLAGHLHTDGELLAGEFNLATAEALREGGPWGSGFPEPMFDGQFGVLETRVVGGRHLKMRLRADSGELVEAIAFRHLDDGSVPGIRADDRVEAAYRTTVDDYTGTRRLQLVTEWVAPLARA